MAELEDDIRRRIGLYVDAARERMSPPPARVVELAPGEQVAWDDTCGMLYSRIASIEPIYRVNAPFTSCEPNFWVVSVAMGALRCAAVMDNKGRPPSADAVTADGFEMLADMQALRQAIMAVPGTRTLTTWLPMGPEGGVHGGEWTFTFRTGVT